MTVPAATGFHLARCSALHPPLGGGGYIFKKLMNLLSQAAHTSSSARSPCTQISKPWTQKTRPLSDGAPHGPSGPGDTLRGRSLSGDLEMIFDDAMDH